MSARTALPAIFLALFATACAKEEITTYQGYVEGEFVNIASAEAGYLERLWVVRGQRIDAQAPLFTLESVRERAAKAEAEHQLKAASAQLEDLKSGKRPPEVSVVQAQLAQAIAEEKKASADWQRDQAQFQAGGISRIELDKSRAAAESSLARLRELTSQVEVAQLPGRREQIKAQGEQMAAARAALEQADWRLQQKMRNSPSAAQVFDTLYREGEWIPAGNPIVRLLPPQNIKIRFFVPETILGRLAPGQTIRIRCDGCAREIAAKVSYISPQAEYTPPVIYSNENRSKLVYMIEAHPAPDDSTSLHPGQPVTIDMINPAGAAAS